MNKIITIGREFGSGGRELGRRLRDELNFAYYDKEIVVEIAKRTSLSEEYVQQIVEKRPVTTFPIHIGRSFYPMFNPVWDSGQAVYQEQHALLKELAGKSDCIIVGRCADYILRDFNPLRIFVYADMETKIRRCRERGDDFSGMTDKELTHHISAVNKDRAKYYQFYTGLTWGDRINYDICINTTAMDMDTISASLVNFIRNR